MKVIGAVTIGKLIEAHYERDEHKFESYAEFIADAYNEMGEERAERIIRSKIDGTYKNKPVVVTLDKESEKLQKKRQMSENYLYYGDHVLKVIYVSHFISKNKNIFQLKYYLTIIYTRYNVLICMQELPEQRKTFS